MACRLIYLTAIALVYSVTLQSARAAPWIPSPVESGPSTASPEQSDPPLADTVFESGADPQGQFSFPSGDAGSDAGFIPSADGLPNLIASTGPNTFPGFVFDTSDQGSDATDSPDNSQFGMNFDFSGNKGDSGTDVKPVPVIGGPWIPVPPNQDDISSLDIDSVVDDLASEDSPCGDLCSGFEDVCSGNDKCVVTENCTTVCNKADGNQTLLEPKGLRPSAERQCDTTGKLCVHGTCQDGQTCVCDMGYEGEMCARKQCSLPCLNAGVCVKASEDRFHCDCKPGWQGALCEQEACTLPCVRGSCRYTPNEESGPTRPPMYCNCPSGWTGDVCEEKVPDPAESSNSKTLALAVGITIPLVCILALVISWYILWRNRVIFVFKISNMFKAYEDNDDKLYDAYVSLTDADYVFVRQVLQPKLEEMGHKLYLHARDETAGDVKSEKILEAVEKSRRCIMLLSADYISNEWCRFEYLLAQHETCIKLKQRIIPILLDDIDKDKKKMDKTLRFIVDSVKCLRYPKPPLDLEASALTSATNLEPIDRKNKKQVKFEKKQAKFWERMRLSMPKKRDNRKEGCPLSQGGSSKPSYSNTSGFRSLFSKLSNGLHVSGHVEKSSATDLSVIEPTSSSEKTGETNPVALISVAALAHPKLDSFYNDTLEKSLTEDRSSESSFVIDGEHTTATGDIHLKL